MGARSGRSSMGNVRRPVIASEKVGVLQIRFGARVRVLIFHFGHFRN